MNDTQAIKLIRKELKKARKKFPKWSSNIVVNAAVVGEESGELIKASLQYAFEGGAYKDCHKEAIQTGAMAVRFLTRK